MEPALPMASLTSPWNWSRASRWMLSSLAPRCRSRPSSATPHKPPTLSAIVNRLLATDPDARYRTAAEVRDALQALQPASVPPPSRRRWLWPAIAAAVAAFVVPTAIDLTRKTPASANRLSDGYRP